MLINAQAAKVAHSKNDNKLPSCQVATYRDGNLATHAPALATDTATSLATNDLTALSTRVLDRSSGNYQATSMATSELPSIKNQATQAIGNRAGNSQLTVLKNLIELTGKALGANETEIAEMLKDTLNCHLVEPALTTFRNLANQLQVKLPRPVNPQHKPKPLVKCEDCAHFKRDSINPCAGIGDCIVNAWGPSQKPLYPFTGRTCAAFKSTKGGQ